MSSVSRPIYSLDDIPGVDAGSPTVDQVLKWNGSAWVPAAYNATYQLAIQNFSTTGISGLTHLIGASKNWKEISAVNFLVVYSNSVPTAAEITVSGTGGATWNAPLELVAPFTGGSNAEVIAYPSVPNTTIVLTVSATNGSTPVTNSLTHTFYNNILTGVSAKSEAFLAEEISGLLNKALVASPSSQTREYVISDCDTVDYIIFAYPTRLGAGLLSIANWRISGRDHGIEGFIQVFPTNYESVLNVINADGYSEEYTVWVSENNPLLFQGLAQDTTYCKVWTGYNPLAGGLPVWWGKTTNPGLDPGPGGNWYTTQEIDLIENGGSMASVDGEISETSFTVARQFSVNASDGEYIIYSVPTTSVSAENVQFWSGGIQGGFLYCGTTSWRTMFGYSTSFHMWRSLYPGLGNTTVVVTVI